MECIVIPGVYSIIQQIYPGKENNCGWISLWDYIKYSTQQTFHILDILENTHSEPWLYNFSES